MKPYYIFAIVLVGLMASVPPLIGGYLVQLFSGPFAIVVDAVSFVFSALCVGKIRAPEPTPPRPPQRNLVREVGQRSFGSTMTRAEGPSP